MSHATHDHGPAAPVRVDAGQLHRSGQRLAAAGRELAADVEADDWIRQAAGGELAGWAAGPAAAEAARAWQELLRTCAGELTELGERLVTAADGYRRCDAHATARCGAAVPR